MSLVSERGDGFPEDEQKQINASLQKACLTGRFEAKKVGEGAFFSLIVFKENSFYFFYSLEEVNVQEVSLTLSSTLNWL